MASPIDHHPALVLLSVLACFAGGPVLGVAVAHWAAPGSELAQFVSPLAFALSFAGGLVLWFGVGVVTVVGRGLPRLLSGRRRRARTAAPPAAATIPPGHGSFLPLALAFGLLAGIVAGSVPQASSFWFSCAAHLVAGAAYGTALRALARRGYLPFPEPA